jgi:pentatricopeptide repeat protein
MVEALVSNGDPGQGLELIHQVQRAADTAGLLNAIIYCSVLKGFSHRKQFDRVWAVYKEMLDLKIDLSVTTYNALLDACARSADMWRVPKLLDEMAHQGIELNTISYSTILKGYCMESKLDMAFDILETMKLNKQCRPDEVTFNSLIDGCARKGLFDRGVALLKEMEEFGIPPTNFTLSVLVKLAGRSRKLDMAFELTSKLSLQYNFKLNAQVYSNLINACIQNKDIPRAFSVLQMMLEDEVQPEVRTYQLLIDASTSLGRYDDAAELLRAALGLSEVLPSLAGFNRASLQPKGGLPKAMVTQVLEEMNKGGHWALVEHTMQDMQRQLSFSIGKNQR